MEPGAPHLVTIMEKKEYSGAAKRIMNLLGNGCLQEEAARALGVDASYVSQLCAEPDFAEQVNALIKKNFQDQSVIDENYLEIEKKLSKRLLDTTDSIFDPDKVLRILKFTNEAKRKLPQGGANALNHPNEATGNTAPSPVVLVVPTKVINQFIMNPNNEIVGVGEEELVTIDNKTVAAMAAERRKEKEEQYQQLADQRKKLNGSRQTDPWSDL